MNIEALLNKYNQNHLLCGISSLPENTKSEYINTLHKVDYELLSRLYTQIKTKPAVDIDSVEPAASTALSSLPGQKKAELEKRGIKIIKDGKCAAVTMAGGQGTRLGYPGPKGCIDIGIGKSLFALQSERLLSLSGRAGAVIPWYIMTSPENNAETISFFNANKNFGYPSDKLFFFVQGTLPMLDKSGKILLSAPGKIAMGPDGNGGVFKALAASGALSDIENRGVGYVFFCGIDNALVKMCDPVFLGFAEQSGLPCASKSVLKRSPEENVGVFCRIKGRPGIIEYSELPQKLRYMLGEDGSLLYGDSNIVAHIIKTDALKKICESGLPYHAAFKKAPFLNENGEYINPDLPNAYKFETFIFDAFSLLPDMAILRVEREKEFAPVKNSSGSDSPETALKLFRENHL